MSADNCPHRLNVELIEIDARRESTVALPVPVSMNPSFFPEAERCKESNLYLLTHLFWHICRLIRRRHAALLLSVLLLLWQLKQEANFGLKADAVVWHLQAMGQPDLGVSSKSLRSFRVVGAFSAKGNKEMSWLKSLEKASPLSVPVEI